MTAGSEQVLGNDRVRSETVGFGVAQVQLGDKQRVACHLHTYSAVIIYNVSTSAHARTYT